MSRSYSDLILMERLLLPILVGVLFFIAALAWNEAIVGTINFFTSEREFLVPTRKELASKWIYTIVITFILILIVYLSRKFLAQPVLNLEAHSDSIVDVTPEAIASSPI